MDPPENGEVNPVLREQFLKIVENQLRSGDPPETKQTLDRLVSEGISRDDAKIYIAQAICIEIWDILKHSRLFNHDRYVRNLARLPEEPRER